MDYLQHFIRDIILTFQNYRMVFPFIQKNKLWKGALNYSWVSKFLLLVGALISLKFSSLFGSWFGNVQADGMSFAAVGSLIQNTAAESYDIFVEGSYKYVILILLEVIIFHFARKTLEVLTGEQADATLKSFIEAQVRMFKVVLFSYVMESVCSVLFGTLTAVAGLEMLKPVGIILIQCFFLGFAVVDNYNEIYKMSIKQSFKYTRQNAGVAIGIGVVLYVLMLIPVIGTVLAPLLGAVTATITMYELNKEDDSLEMALVENEF